jgi:hypothetical protein
MSKLGAQKGADLRQVLGRIASGSVGIFLRSNRAEMPLIVEKLGRHLLDGQHFVHEAGGRRALRHPAHRRVVDTGLRQSEPAALLDRFQAERSVAAGAREDDADSVFPLILRQRVKECVDRLAAFARRRWPHDSKLVVLDG